MGILKEKAAALRLEAARLEKQEEMEQEHASVKFGGVIYFTCSGYGPVSPRLIVRNTAAHALREAEVLLIDFDPKSSAYASVCHRANSLAELKQDVGPGQMYRGTNADKPTPAGEVKTNSKPTFSFADPFLNADPYRSPRAG